MPKWIMLACVLTAGQSWAACPTLLQHEVRALNSTDTVNLCESYAGDVLLVVNTASFCGFTYQYKQLQALQDRFADQGLQVLGFPSNDFARQEPGSEQDIKTFCELNYGVTFPLFAKNSVKEGAAQPLYQALAEAAGEYPRWNFHKYLIGRDGQLLGSYPSQVEPESATLLEAINRAL